MPEIRNEGFQVLTLGAVKKDGTPDIANILFSFPVPHQQMSVRQAVKIDEVRVPGRSGKVKQGVGYEDTEVSVALTLVDREDRGANVVYSAVQQLKDLQAAFRDRSDPVGTTTSAPKTAPRNVPTIFSIQSRLTDACGIKTVLFKSLDVSESPGDTALEVNISMVEFEPAPLVPERRRKKKTTELEDYMADMAYYDSLEAADMAGADPAAAQAAAIAAATAQDAQASAAHDAEVGEEDPLTKVFRQGKADAMASGGKL